MKLLLTKIIEYNFAYTQRKKFIFDYFDVLSLKEKYEIMLRLDMDLIVLKGLQDAAFNALTPAEIWGIANNGVYTEGGLSNTSMLEISAKVAFGEKPCSAEQWYTNAKYQALYPNKYEK